MDRAGDCGGGPGAGNLGLVGSSHDLALGDRDDVWELTLTVPPWDAEQRLGWERKGAALWQGCGLGWMKPLGRWNPPNGSREPRNT